MIQVEVTAHDTTLATMPAGDVTAKIGSYMSTYEALLLSLGSCSAITLQMYAERKGWPLETARVRLTLEKGDKEKPNRIEQHVELVGDLDDDQRERLRVIAGRCPIHRILEGPIEFEEFLEATEAPA